MHHIILNAVELMTSSSGTGNIKFCRQSVWKYLNLTATTTTTILPKLLHPCHCLPQVKKWV